MELLFPGMGLIMLILLSYVVFFILIFFVIRWVFRVNRQVNMQEKQLQVLTALALKVGVDKQVLQDILTTK